MFSSRFLIIFFLASSLSSNAIAHSGKHHLLGGSYLVAAALNVLELGKHALVVGDQLLGQDDDRNYYVLVGNALMAAAHVVHAKAYLDELYHRQHNPYLLPALVASNALGAFDFYVDGITTWEYWAKDPSWQKTAIMLAAPTCLASNLLFMVSKT